MLCLVIWGCPIDSWRLRKGMATPVGGINSLRILQMTGKELRM